MVRKPFKRAITTVIPASAERSLFVLVASLVLEATLFNWAPLPEPIIAVTPAEAGSAVAVAAWGFHFATCAFFLLTTFAIDHFELFGVKQALGVPLPTAFKEHLLYTYVRHPIMTGFFLLMWSCPVQSCGHVLSSAILSACILVAVALLEEPDPLRAHGESYRSYMRRVPAYFPSVTGSAIGAIVTMVTGSFDGKSGGKNL